VEDHGRGIPEELLRSNGEPSLVNMGVGMRGMEERLRQLGGCLTIASQPGRTVVRADVPVSEEVLAEAASNAKPRLDGGVPGSLNGVLGA
jgi:two-component system NarL family sensor kinase